MTDSLMESYEKAFSLLERLKCLGYPDHEARAVLKSASKSGISLDEFEALVSEREKRLKPFYLEIDS